MNTNCSTSTLLLRGFTLFIFAFLLGACGRSNCQLTSENQEDMLLRFRAHIQNEETIAPKYLYPTPTPLPDSMYRWIDDIYTRSIEVRNLVVQYYLRYDDVLLQKGLLTASVDPHTILRILWEKEALRNKTLQETPSSYEMRNHILQNPDWFGLTCNQIQELLQHNKRLEEIVDPYSS